MNLKLVKIIIIISILLSVKINFAQNMKINQFKLENGLTVILNEDHSKPEVFGLVVCKTGGKNDPDDATGMAHYQEHMLFKGTENLGTSDWTNEKPHIDKIFELYDKLGETKDKTKRTEIQKQINEESLKANKYAIPNELSNLINIMGGTKLNAGTGWDMTVFYNAFPPNQIEKWIELYSHRFINPVFRGFQSELEVVYEEKNMYSDMFFTAILEKFNHSFFKNHPYGQQTIIGTSDDLKNPSLTKMYKFFKTYYVANNMALVITGDFNTDEITPLIKEKFGKWQSGTIPEPKVYEEAPFEGREFISARLSPIKIGLFGFRTVPNGHKDKIKIDVCNALLANQNQTGLLDKLVLDGKIMAAMSFNMGYNDYGAGMFLVIPKLVGQSLKSAEELVFTEIKKLRTGNFDDWMLEAIKNQLYVQHQESVESLESRANLFAQYFSIGKDLKDISKYSEEINKITKDDIIETAKTYFGDNYLAMYSKMGKPKKDKIAKPNYEAVISKNKAESDFTKAYNKINGKEYKFKYINFEKDIKEINFSEKTSFYYTENPINDVFSLDIEFTAGSKHFPKANYIAQIMGVSGAGKYNSSQLKKEFNKIGCTYNFYSDNNSFTLNISGLEKNLQEALKLTNLIISEPKGEQDKVKIIIEGEKTGRKMERSEPDNVASALFDYVKYGEKSKYLDRLSMKEIKKLQANDLVNEFKEITKYYVNFHYVGSPKIIDESKVAELIKTTIKLPSESKAKHFIVDNVKNYNENTVFVVNKKKARQSKIYFMINADKYDKNQQAVIDAFNTYFGGGFSGIVLQEVREYRSLAYSAGARFITPELIGKSSYFIGYVGTQSDKTIEAFEIFYSLIKNMPQKPERMPMIKSYLTLSEITKQPGFRDLTKQVEKWERLDYKYSPIKSKMPIYKNLEFKEIYNFYKENIKDKPIVIAFVGDTKHVDIDKLKKYGKIVTIKEKALFKK